MGRAGGHVAPRELPSPEGGRGANQVEEGGGTGSLGWGVVFTPPFSPCLIRYPVSVWDPLQYSCLENSMGRGAWQAKIFGVAKSRT